MKNEKLYLIHIIEAINTIYEYTQGNKEDFFASPIVRDAVLKHLQNLSESTQHISRESQSLQPHIEWRKIRAFRNVLVHDYLGNTNYELIWNVIANELPLLKEAVQRILEVKDNNDSSI